jgi:hypothetical protein
MGKRPLRQLSYEDQAASFQQKAQALQSKAQKQWIDDQLKIRPELIPAVVQHLKGLGCKSQGDAQQPRQLKEVGPTSALGPTTPSKTSSAGSSGMPDGSLLEGNLNGSLAEAEEEEQEESKNPKVQLPVIPKKYKAWENVPTTYIQAILKAMEPVAFSQANLRSFHPKSCKYLLKEPLLCLLEFCLDWDRKASVPCEQRAVGRLLGIVKELNIVKGRRAQSLELPCDWGDVGHYRLSDSEGGVMITLNTVGTLLTKPVCSMGCFISVKGADELQVMENWNLLSAVVIIKQCGTRCPAVMIFQGEPALAAALSSVVAVEIKVEEEEKQDDKKDKAGLHLAQPAEGPGIKEEPQEPILGVKTEQEDGGEPNEEIKSKEVNEEGLIPPPPEA